MTLGLINRNFKHMSIPTFVALYKSMVRSNLDYCCPVWYGAPARHVICLNKNYVCLNKLQFVQTNYNLFEQIVTNNFFHVSPGLRSLVTLQKSWRYRGFREGPEKSN